MTQRPTPPIIVCDNGDLEVYPDTESACAELEAYDAVDVEVFDSIGYLLLVETRGNEVTGLSIVDGVSPTPRELERRLGTFIARVGPDRVGLHSPETASTQDALEALLQFFQGEPSSRGGLRSCLSSLKRKLRRH